MCRTFNYCYKLATITINANPTEWTQAIYGTKITSISGTTNMGDDIILTKSSTATNPVA
jgi:hypothetical protein